MMLRAQATPESELKTALLSYIQVKNKKMNQLKNDIIDKINRPDDINVINALNNILDNLKAPAIQKLQAGEKRLISMGVEDYKNGNFMDDAALREEENKWLNE